MFQLVPGGLQHGRRLVDADDPADERRQGAGHRSGAAAEVAHRPVAAQEAEQRGESGVPAEELAAQAVPVAGGRREELPGATAATGPDGLETLDVASRLLGGGHLAPGQAPELAGQRLELFPAHPVEAAGTVAADLQPAVVRQHLQVPAHGGLGQVQHLGELRHRQLPLLEDQEQTAPGWIGQNRHAVADWRTFGHGVSLDGRETIHPSIRIYC